MDTRQAMSNTTNAMLRTKAAVVWLKVHLKMPEIRYKLVIYL